MDGWWIMVGLIVLAVAVQNGLTNIANAIMAMQRELCELLRRR